MGLFDQYQFDQGSYGGGGSLIDRLLSQPQTQGQYQPSHGFGSNPMDANAQMQSQAMPIAVGGYQMPRVGEAAQFDSQQVNLPPNAQPTSGQMPMQASSLPQFLQPSGPGNNLLAGLESFANSDSIISGVVNGLTGLATGQRGDLRGRQQQALQAEYKALVPILGPQKAMLAVISPEAAKTLIPQALSSKARFTKTGQDSLGRETYGFVNENDQTVNGRAYQSAAANGEGDPLGNTNLSGKEYLATLPKAQANTVQMMVEGRLAPPTSFAMTKPYWQNMIVAAKNYDPTFDATAWSGRVAGVKDFSAGKSAEMVRSANQTIGHVGDLIDKMDALGNGQYPAKNAIGNYISSNFLRNKGVVGFQQNAHAVADELSKVFKGAGISDHEIKQWEQSLSPNMSPEQQRESVSTMLGLLRHSLTALEEKRLNSMGGPAAEKAGPLLNGQSQAILERAEKWAAGQEADTVAAPKSLNAGESTTIKGVTIKRIK